MNLYDSEKVPALTPVESIAFFKSPVGCKFVFLVLSKSRADTNMQQSGQIPAPYVFEAKAVVLHLSHEQDELFKDAEGELSIFTRLDDGAWDLQALSIWPEGLQKFRPISFKQIKTELTFKKPLSFAAPCTFRIGFNGVFKDRGY